MLAIHEIGGAISHVPEVLTHWRRTRHRQLSAAQLKLRNHHLVRCYGCNIGSALAGHVGALQSVHSGQSPLVTIVIPTKDRTDLLEACLASIFRSEPVVSFEVVILDNRSSEPDSLRWLSDAPNRFTRVRVLNADYEFNWSRLNNQGVAAARGRVCVFLNNDVEVISAEWLDYLSAQSLRADAGAVGALLFYPDGSIQHAGVVMGIGGFADHVYSGCATPETDEHLFAGPYVGRNVMACTGACLAVEKSKLASVGGFNEALRICGDVDLCLRLHEFGYRNVYEPRACLWHHESATRSKANLPRAEIETAMQTCGACIESGDPFYNRNLTMRLRYPTFRRENEI
jgi:GT2 family glycosyltransferase